jgi:hypothetical protein
MTYRTLSADLAKFGVTVDKRKTKCIREAAIAAFDYVRRHNPVNSGWSRASWTIGITKPKPRVWSHGSNSFVEGMDWHGNKPAIGSAIAEPPMEFFPSLRWDDKIYISNFVWYVGFVEAKHGMLAGAIENAKLRLAIVARSMAK